MSILHFLGGGGRGGGGELNLYCKSQSAIAI